MESPFRVAVVGGDGIGPEVIREAVRTIETVERALGRPVFELTEWHLGADRYLDEGVAITDEEFRAIRDDHDAVLLGALGDPRVPDNEHAREILLGLRFRLDLYINHRPAVLMKPELSPLRGASSIGIDIFRENTEGAYAGMGGSFRVGTPDEVAIEEDVNTRKGTERIIRAAFEFARDQGRGLVTLVDKANAQRWVGALYRRVFEEVSRDFPELETEAAYVDAVAMELVRRPERFEVVVTSNLFGDIISDLAAAVTGGLGLAPSANLHPGAHALFEPVHGSAPDLAGCAVANPLGAIRCAGMMLAHFGIGDAARAVEEAARRSIGAAVTTPDVGGSATTGEVGRWVAGMVEELLEGRKA